MIEPASGADVRGSIRRRCAAGLGVRSVRPVRNRLSLVPAAGHAAVLRAGAGRRHGGGKDQQCENNMDALGAG